MATNSLEQMEVFDQHVANTIDAFKNFVVVLQTELNSKGVLSTESAKSLHVMSQGVEELRDLCILSAINSGLPGKSIARAYNLSPGRISQIKKNGIRKKEVTRLYSQMKKDNNE